MVGSRFQIKSRFVGPKHFWYPGGPSSQFISQFMGVPLEELPNYVAFGGIYLVVLPWFSNSSWYLEIKSRFVGPKHFWYLGGPSSQFISQFMGVPLAELPNYIAFGGIYLVVLP